MDTNSKSSIKVVAIKIDCLPPLNTQRVSRVNSFCPVSQACAVCRKVKPGEATSFLPTEAKFVWAVEVLVLFSSQTNIRCDFLRPAHFAYSLSQIEAVYPRLSSGSTGVPSLAILLFRWYPWSFFKPETNVRGNNKMHKTVPFLSLSSVLDMHTWRAREGLPLWKCSRVWRKTCHGSDVWWGLRPLCLRMSLIGECPVWKGLTLDVNDPTATYVAWKSAESFRRKDFSISI